MNQQLLQFIAAAPTAFHAVSQVSKHLEADG